MWFWERGLGSAGACIIPSPQWLLACSLGWRPGWALLLSPCPSWLHRRTTQEQWSVREAQQPCGVCASSCPFRPVRRWWTVGDRGPWTRRSCPTPGPLWVCFHAPPEGCLPRLEHTSGHWDVPSVCCVLSHFCLVRLWLALHYAVIVHSRAVFFFFFNFVFLNCEGSGTNGAYVTSKE